MTQLNLIPLHLFDNCGQEQIYVAFYSILMNRTLWTLAQNIICGLVNAFVNPLVVKIWNSIPAKMTKKKEYTEKYINILKKSWARLTFFKIKKSCHTAIFERNFLFTLPFDNSDYIVWLFQYEIIYVLDKKKIISFCS